MSQFTAILEGPEWLADHPRVLDGTLAFAAGVHLEPWKDQKASGEKAAEHYEKLNPAWPWALKPHWPGVRGMDIGRRLDDGTMVGCTVDEWLNGMRRGVFPIDREADLLNAAVAPVRPDFLRHVGKATRAVVTNCEPASDPLGRVHPDSLTKGASESDAAFARRREAAQMNWEAWERYLNGRPLAPDDIRRFNQCKANTLRALLRAAGLLVPGVTHLGSFLKFAGGSALGYNDEPIQTIDVPRDPGVVWPDNWQWYDDTGGGIARAMLFRASSSRPVWPTLFPLTAWRLPLGSVCRGGVVWWIDEDLRARYEGRADENGASKGTEDFKKSSEDWMTNQAAGFTTAFREGR